MDKGKELTEVKEKKCKEKRGETMFKRGSYSGMVERKGENGGKEMIEEGRMGEANRGKGEGREGEGGEMEKERGEDNLLRSVDRRA